jgi:hypothetical protein
MPVLWDEGAGVRIELVSVCVNSHVTSTEVLNAQVLADGTVEGLTGSSADFCDICDSDKMTALSTREMAS